MHIQYNMIERQYEYDNSEEEKIIAIGQEEGKLHGGDRNGMRLREKLVIGTVYTIFKVKGKIQLGKNYILKNHKASGCKGQ